MFKIRNLSVGWGKMYLIMPKNGPFIIFLWILLLFDSMGEKNIVGDLSTPVGCDVAAIKPCWATNMDEKKDREMKNV